EVDDSRLQPETEHVFAIRQAMFKFRLLVFLFSLLAILAFRHFKGLDGFATFGESHKPREIPRPSLREVRPVGRLEIRNLVRESRDCLDVHRDTWTENSEAVEINPVVNT